MTPDESKKVPRVARGHSARAVEVAVGQTLAMDAHQPSWQCSRGSDKPKGPYSVAAEWSNALAHHEPKEPFSQSYEESTSRDQLQTMTRGLFSEDSTCSRSATRDCGSIESFEETDGLAALRDSSVRSGDSGGSKSAMPGSLSRAGSEWSGADTVSASLDSETFVQEVAAADTGYCGGEAEVEDEITQYRSGAIYQLMDGKRLCFACHTGEIQTMAEIERFPKIFFFSSDLQDRYQNFCSDFGPVNLSIVRRFCSFVHEKYTDPRLATRTIVYYADDEPASRTNTAFLLGAYMMLCHRLSAREAFRPFKCLRPYPLTGFRDATYLEPTYTLDVLDCLEGLQRAMDLGWFDVSEFDLEEYEYWDHPLNGDMHRMSPKFIAFKGPSEHKTQITKGFYTFIPSEYTDVFREMGVTAVVRLNEPDTYDAEHFPSAGFNFYDLEFDDCSCPPDEIVKKFLDICDAEKGVVAVHCKAGLGRTGTLIALHMMKHQGFTAKQAMGWLRIVRPGSVIGPQQQYLEGCDSVRWEGNFPHRLQTHDSNAEDSRRIAAHFAKAMNVRGATRATASATDAS